MTRFETPIRFGKKYVDDRSGLVGVATSLEFMAHGCVVVGLEQYGEKDGVVDINTSFVNELRLKPLEGAADAPMVYETDIELNKKYRDIETGLEGHSTTIQFSENQCTRAFLRTVSKDKEGAPVQRYHVIDEFLLESLETKQVAADKSGKRSPCTETRSGPSY